jgi:tetratricopeptide (TPR) repeat protein
MKRGIGIALLLLGCIAALPAYAQQSGSGAASSQNKQQPQQPKPVPPKPQDSNPFPTDTTNVPVMPSRENPEPNVPSNTPTGTADQIEDARHLPGDSDPVPSPDTASPAGGDYQGPVSSSNANSLDSILPPTGDDETKGKKGSQIEDKPQETAAKDISVAKYYLDNKNWRAALSRFQSALVLAPEDPEVYWGLAVSQQHMGDFAGARANYEKVLEYDPDGKHAKEAKKALKEPDLANAKPAPSVGQK